MELNVSLISNKTLILHSVIWLCYFHATYAFQSASTFYSCLNVQKLLARNRHDIWSLSDSNGVRTHHHLVCKRALNRFVKLVIWLAKWLSVPFELSGCGLESRCCHLNSIICLEMGIASVTNKKLLYRKGVVISSCFLWRLWLFTIKSFCNLLYNSICGLLCLLICWRSINSHS